MKFSQVVLMSSTFSSLYSVQHNLIYKSSTLVLYCRQPIYTINILWIGCLYFCRGCLTVKKINNRTQPIPALGLWFCQPIMPTLSVYLHVISKLLSPCLMLNTLHAWRPMLTYLHCAEEFLFPVLSRLIIFYHWKF